MLLHRSVRISLIILLLSFIQPLAYGSEIFSRPGESQASFMASSAYVNFINTCPQYGLTHDTKGTVTADDDIFSVKCLTPTPAPTATPTPKTETTTATTPTPAPTATPTPKTETTTATTPTPKTETTTAVSTTSTSSNNSGTDTNNQMQLIVSGPDASGVTSVGICFTNPSRLSGSVTVVFGGAAMGGRFGALIHSEMKACPTYLGSYYGYRLTPGTTYNYSATASNNGNSWSASVNHKAPGNPPTATITDTKTVTSQTETKTVTSQTDTKTVTTRTETPSQSETRTAQIAEVASISNSKERTVAAVELIKTFDFVEKEQALDVTYKSKNSSVIDVDLAVPGIPVVVTATKKGSPTIILKSTTDTDGDAQIKTTKNLEGYSVTLAVNKVKIDTDVVKKKK